jgi:hypothetical protein
LATLADDLIAVAAKVPRALAPIKKQYDYVAERLKSAQRFVVTPDARTAIRALLSSRPSSVRTALEFARLPYPTCWFEWEPPADASPLGAGQLKCKRVGALFEQLGGPLEAGFFTAWKFDDGVEHLRDPRFQKYPQMRDLAQFGVSSMQAGFDFSSFDGEVTLLKKPGWTRHRSPNRDDLEKMRNDAKNGVRYALKEEGEHLALLNIEKRCVYRIFEEIGGYDMIQMAGAMGGGDYVSSAIRDVSDEIGHLVATLVLMNSKNCVALRPYEPPLKLNKARLKAGKTALLPYSTVEITLNRPAQRAVEGASESEREAMRLHLVRGHFKVRKTGVFWWHHFMRGDESKGEVKRKSHTITAEGVK